MKQTSPTSPPTGETSRPIRPGLKTRCRMISAVAAEICDRSQALIEACASDQRTDPVETITSELLPLCAALKFIGRRGPRILASRRIGLWGRPGWLWGVRATIERQPLGTVLVLGTWNYPLLLPGVQAAQALAAGNRVRWKPAPGTESASALLAECFYSAGIRKDQLTLLSSETAAAVSAIDDGPDLIVLTGAAETGRKVLTRAASQLIPSIMELSGCDAVVTLPGHDRGRLLDALRFGVCFNSGATCIAPRRLLICSGDAPELVAQLAQQLRDVPAMTVHPAAREKTADMIAAALAEGAHDILGHFDESALRQHGGLRPVLLGDVTSQHAIASADVFAPVLCVMRATSVDDAVDTINASDYRLAASVFGPAAEAKRVAAELDVGTVTINDLIAPTADPRLPFGGRGQSGFGVTRGREGLLAMTTAKVVCTRHGRFLPHLRDRTPADKALLQGLLEVSHSRGLSKRLAGLRRMVRGVKKGT